MRRPSSVPPSSVPPSEAANAPEAPSRSRRKRDSTALQAVGEQLAALSPSALATLPLTPDLADALAALPRMRTHEARRRQLQYIGRLMREAEEEGALEAIVAGMGRL